MFFFLDGGGGGGGGGGWGGRCLGLKKGKEILLGTFA